MSTTLRTIHAEQITNAVATLCINANRVVPTELHDAVQQGMQNEKSERGRNVLQLILENYATAAETGLPICQDTGLAVFLVEIGQDVHIDGDLSAAINAGVQKGYQDGYLRKSAVVHPLHRVNTGDNTPAIIHTSLVPGDQIRLTLIPKGGGSENASALQMLKPSDGEEGVINFVVERVSAQGVNACPPLIIGVGIGSNFEGCALLAKHALLRPIGQPNRDPENARLEQILLAKINALGIGPAGFGGSVTALAVHVETAPCHIASLPCAVNIQCNAHRCAEVVL
ncbi:MAG TPA: fumarate hydratase [Armatimonadota bacterium]|nr:fumarate hydratase [Armatimonadota bacterium]